MTNNKYSTLISKLIDSTKENRLNWQKTSRQNEYSTEVSSYMVSIVLLSPGTFVIGKDRNETYALTLINEEGDNIDTQEITHSNPDFDNIANLYAEAKRSFYKVDEVLESLIQNL